MLVVEKVQYLLNKYCNEYFIVFMCVFLLGVAFSAPTLYVTILLELSLLSLVFTTVYLFGRTLLENAIKL